MTTHRFTVEPGAATPNGAAVVPLTNIRPSTEPPEPLKTLIDSLTGTYDAYQKRWFAHTWYRLYDAGVLETSDLIMLHGLSQHDALINWTGKTTPTLIGGSFSTSLGIILDGVDDYIDTNVTPATDTGLSWTLNSASAAVLVTDGPNVAAQAYAIGQVGGATLNLSLRPKNNSGAIQAGGSINGTTQVTVAYSGPWDGFWMINRTDNDSVRLLRDGALLAFSDSNAVNTLPTGKVSLGRQSNSYGAVKVGGAVFGAGRTPQQESDVATILKEHYARMVI
jgi:hypothetical protein